jgi:D-alanyl-D-alanine carboxypeptidase/D-alanyl-D-alanine-endopeptidase (penicillin-binding protein 4)
VSRALALALAVAAPSFGADLAERIAAAVDGAPAPVRGVFGVHVLDLATGQTVYARNESQPLLPASNMKLFTAALALARLGPDYRFDTRLVREPSGDVALIGSGDPTLSGRVYPYARDTVPGDPLAAIEQLADQAVAAGLRRVDGNIVGDDRRYPWSPYPASWTADDMLNGYGAPVSALSLNDNVIAVAVRPGARPGDLARVLLNPPVEYFAIDNRVRTVEGGGAANLSLTRVPGARQILLAGTIGARAAAAAGTAVIDDPALYAAHALYAALLNRGVVIRGRPLARHRAAPGDPPPVIGETLALRRSPPLSQILETLAKVSHNLHSELVLREVAFLTRGDGTTELGLAAMRDFLAEIGVPPTEWQAEDGSGLARNDQAAPRAVTRLLAHMASSPQASLWETFLPAGGEDGTLSERLCCVSDAAAIRAKTGSLARAVALSGYARSRANGRLAFSILVNNFTAPAAQVRTWVDRIAMTLVE